MSLIPIYIPTTIVEEGESYDDSGIQARVGAVEADNQAQQTTIDSTAASVNTFDNRIDAVEAVNTTQQTALDNILTPANNSTTTLANATNNTLNLGSTTTTVNVPGSLKLGNKIIIGNSNAATLGFPTTTGSNDQIVTRHGAVEMFNKIIVGNGNVVGANSLKNGNSYAAINDNPAEIGQVLTYTADDRFTWVDPAGGSGATTLSGDVSGPSNANIVASVGGKSAAEIAASVNELNAATATNTSNTILKRDAAGSFSSNVGNFQNVRINNTTLVGNSSGSLTLPPATDTLIARDTFDTLKNKTLIDSSNNISANALRNVNVNTTAPTTGQVLTYDGTNASWVAPSGGGGGGGSTTLSGDVTGLSESNTVATVGGKSAASVATSVNDTTNATADSNVNTLVKRDASGNINANIGGFDTVTLNKGSADASLKGINFEESGTLNGYVRVNATRNGIEMKAPNGPRLQTPTAFNGVIDNGKYLRVDAAGNTSWQAIPASGGDPTMSGDVVGTASANTVATVGGKSAAQIATAVDDTLGATSDNVNNTIVKRNASGNATLNALTLSAGGNQLTLGNVTIATSGVARTMILPVISTSDLLTSRTSTDTLTNKTLRSTNNNISANSLRNGATLIDLTTTAPTNGQVLSYDGTNAVWATPATGASTLSGDVTGTLTSNTVATVGGKSAAAIATSVNDTLNATDANTDGTLLKRVNNNTNIFSINGSVIPWTSSDFLVGTQTVDSLFNKRMRNATNDISANAFRHGNNIVDLIATPPTTGQVLSYNGTNAVWTTPAAGGGTTLSGDVSGTLTSNTVATVGGKEATAIANSVDATLGATANNTDGTIVKRVSNNFNISTINGSVIPYASGDTLVANNTVNTLTNKTLTSATNNIAANALRHGSNSFDLSTTMPLSGQVLSYDGTNAVWTTPVPSSGGNVNALLNGGNSFGAPIVFGSQDSSITMSNYLGAHLKLEGGTTSHTNYNNVFSYSPVPDVKTNINNFSFDAPTNTISNNSFDICNIEATANNLAYSFVIKINVNGSGVSMSRTYNVNTYTIVDGSTVILTPTFSASENTTHNFILIAYRLGNSIIVSFRRTLGTAAATVNGSIIASGKFNITVETPGVANDHLYTDNTVITNTLASDFEVSNYAYSKYSSIGNNNKDAARTAYALTVSENARGGLLAKNDGVIAAFKTQSYTTSNGSSVLDIFSPSGSGSTRMTTYVPVFINTSNANALCVNGSYLNQIMQFPFQIFSNLPLTQNTLTLNSPTYNTLSNITRNGNRFENSGGVDVIVTVTGYISAANGVVTIRHWGSGNAFIATVASAYSYGTTVYASLNATFRMAPFDYFTIFTEANSAPYEARIGFLSIKT